MYDTILILCCPSGKLCQMATSGMHRLHDCEESWRGEAHGCRFFQPKLQLLRQSRAVFTIGNVGAILQRMTTSLPVIDLRLARNGPEARSALARQLDLACSEFGFFYLVGHDVEPRLSARLVTLAREFFARDQGGEDADSHVARRSRMARVLPVGGELTSGQPDLKEGLYFGTELDDTHPRVRAGTPMHGRNLFPDVPDFRASVLAYMSALESAGQQVLSLMAEGLRLSPDYFQRHPHR
jgi:isopenicillin N synthase-like dioxygenase